MQGIPAEKVLITVHGTGDATAQLANPKWWQRESEFAKKIIERAQSAGETVRFHSFCWSGANSQTSRMSASKSFAKKIRSDFPGADIHIVAHSHGGNVVLDSLCELGEVKDNIKSILLVGTPHLRRASTLSEFAYFILSVLALLPLLIMSINAEPFLNYCVNRPGLADSASWFDQLFFTNPDLYSGGISGDTTCSNADKSIFLKEPWFLFPFTAVLFAFSCVIAESRQRFLYLGTLNVLLILLWLAMTYLPDNKAGFSLFNHIVLQLLIWSAGSLMAGYLFRRAIEVEVERRRWVRSFSLFADCVKQVYHSKDEAIDLLRSVRKSRIALASQEQAARLVETFLLSVLLLTVVVLTVFLTVFLFSNIEDEFVRAFLGDELINSDTLILGAIISIPLFVGLSFFLLNLLSMWLGEAVSEAGATIANRSLGTILSNATLGDDASGRVIVSEERFVQINRIPIPENEEKEMTRLANDAIQSTVLFMIENYALAPSGILANPAYLASLITYREVVHCGYFETDFVANLVVAEFK